MIQASDMRLESDSIGKKNVPQDAYYGVQSLRALENFDITGLRMRREMIESLALLKKACAIANKEAGALDPVVADAIVAACDDTYMGKYHDQFIVDPIQGGAGTSMNMNANEVIANIAAQKLGGTLGDYSLVHPNDHVNCGQSTNDIVPTAGKLTTLVLLQSLERSMQGLYVSSCYTTHNGGDNDGAMTLSCVVDGQTIDVRTIVLYDQNGEMLTASAFEGRIIDVVGIVDYFGGRYQIKVLSAQDIVVH